MFHRTHLTIAAVALLGAIPVSTADASRLATHVPGSDVINVNVSINLEVPVSDRALKTISREQTEGRKILYRLATSECKVLTATIAETCRLTNLNVSTQLRNKQSMYVNGNAQFAITLKASAMEWDEPPFPDETCDRIIRDDTLFA